MVLAAVIAQVIMGAARLLRSCLSVTCGLCERRAMRTANLGGFLRYSLDGELLLIVGDASRRAQNERSLGAFLQWPISVLGLVPRWFGRGREQLGRLHWLEVKR